MTDEGVRFVSRIALVGVMIVVTAIFRTMVGPGRRRGRIMLAGTLGGISTGVLLSTPISSWLGTDASAICACLGVFLGWCLSWRFARRVPRGAD